MGISKLKLKQLLKRKNPYLFRAKAVDVASDLVSQLLTAYMSSKEETIFGDFLEALAISICAEAFGGQKSVTEGIDLELSRDGLRYIVSIKSGPNWGNSQQIKRMASNFTQAKKIVGKSRLEAVNGCCYGQERNVNRGDYSKYCGQDFWELVSGVDDFYQQIVEPLGAHAKERTQAFHKKYAQVANQFTAEFIQEFCTPTGEIDWDKLLQFNSGRE
jgi:hypothetical protein